MTQILETPSALKSLLLKKVLILNDGQIFTESIAIRNYLEAYYPEKRLVSVSSGEKAQLTCGDSEAIRRSF